MGEKESGLSVAQRLQNKKQRAMEDLDRGDDHDTLLDSIKNAANDFHSRQQHMDEMLKSTLKEKQQLAQGKIAESAQNDAVKRQVSDYIVKGNEPHRRMAMDAELMEMHPVPEPE